MHEPLLPKDLTSKDVTFKTVEELHDILNRALNEGEIKNIALTGPFGSGKSSILQTLRKTYKEFEYLPISLATLHLGEEENDNEVEDGKNGVKEDSRQTRENEKMEIKIIFQMGISTIDLINKLRN